MATAEQEARAYLAQARAADHVATPANTDGIRPGRELPSPVSFAADTARSMLTPGNVIRTAGEAAGFAATKTQRGAAIGGLVAQPLATLAQRKWNSFTGQPSSSGYFTDLGYDAVTNELSRRIVGPVLSYAGGKAMSSKPVQKGLASVARRILGDVTPDARRALDISDGIINDLSDAVNSARSKSGKPLLSRQQVEEKLTPYLPMLRDKGMFTVGDLTTGTPVDTIEGVSAGSVRGKARFGQKREAANAAIDAWPKVFAAALGDEAIGPDALADMASREILRGTRRAVRSAGGKVGAVETLVKDAPVQIDEGILDGIQDEISLYAKRMGGGGKKIALDPERIDTPLAASISLVERATGKKFNFDTGAFEDRVTSAVTGDTMVGGVKISDLEKTDPNIRAKVQAAGFTDPAAEEVVEPKTFTFSDVRRLRSYLGQMEAKIPETERRSAASALSGVSAALKERQLSVLDDYDAANGLKDTDSLRWKWESANTGYAEAVKLREGFPARGWVEALDKYGKGREVIPQIWPDDADFKRVEALRDLLGGESSPYWKTMRRFKVEEMLSRSASNPRALYEKLTTPQGGSADYWRATLGSDGYDRLRDFAELATFMGKKNPGANRIMGSMLDSGMTMQTIGDFTDIVTANSTPSRALRGVMRPVGWFVSTKKVAEWLNDPKHSTMFMSVLKGDPIRRKASSEWFRNQVARSVADAAKDEEPAIRPIPTTATMDELRGFRRASGE